MTSVPDYPLSAARSTRKELQNRIADRFEGDYSPSLVYIEDEWHYPLAADVTMCGRRIGTEPVLVRQEEFGGPSGQACQDCGVPMGNPNSRDITNRIRLILGLEFPGPDRFNKDERLAILQAVESVSKSAILDGGSGENKE